MSMNSLKQWMPVAFLAFAPLASAQTPSVMDNAQRGSMTTALAATPVQSPEEQEIAALRQELDGIRAELRVRRERDEEREQSLGDPNSHPLWP